MRKRNQQALTQRDATARIRELAHELGGLLKLFPDLEDSFDADELPISFRLKAAGERAERKAIRRRAKSTAAQREAAAKRMKVFWAKHEKGVSSNNRASRRRGGSRSRDGDR
jgi:hypothetical protein